MSHLKTLTNRITAYNSTFAIGGVSSPIDSFMVAESFVLRIKFSGKKPARTQSPKTLAASIAEHKMPPLSKTNRAILHPTCPHDFQ
jgi:hypothetical protein